LHCDTSDFLCSSKYLDSKHRINNEDKVYEMASVL
jgi:hypothetical protein